MDATLNYGMAFELRYVFGKQLSMALLKSRHETNKKYYKDVDALGLFAECQDLDRLLSLVDDVKIYYNLLAYIFTARGIPILYYGSEQGFNGGQDPLNRETMFGLLN